MWTLSPSVALRPRRNTPTACRALKFPHLRTTEFLFAESTTKFSRHCLVRGLNSYS